MSVTYKNPQSPIRVAILENGFRFTINHGKRARGKDWAAKAMRSASTQRKSIAWWDAAITEDGSHVPNASTGLLIEGDLIALDVDIDDKATVDEMHKLATDIFGDDWAEGVLERYREGSYKVCWLFRVADPLPGDPEFETGGRQSKERYWPPNFVEDGGQIAGVVTENGWTRNIAGAKPELIEFFLGGGCQIGALGWHTLPGESEKHPDGIQYRWTDDMTPANTDRQALPKVSHARLMEFYVGWGKRLRELGWTRDTRITGKGKIAYDLDTERTYFVGEDGQRDGLIETPYRELQHGQQVRMAEVLGSQDGSNAGRGWVRVRDNRVIGIYDREAALMHYPASEDPSRPAKMAERLGEMLAGLNTRTEDDASVDEAVDTVLTGDQDDNVEPLHPEEDVWARVAEILTEHGVAPSVEDEDMEEVADLYQQVTRNWVIGDSDDDDYQVEARAMLLALRWLYIEHPGAERSHQKWRCLAPGKAPYLTRAAFLDEYDVWATYRKGEAENAETFSKRVTEIFSKSALRIKIQKVEFNPRSPYRIARVPSYGWLTENTYQPPKLGKVRPEMVALTGELLAWMWDRQDELDIFEECMAYKFEHPAERGVTHIMIADGVEGVGRNTLVEWMLFSALGHDNCYRVNTNKVKSGRGQDQFDAWMFGSILWFLPELEAIGSDSWANLKEKLETSSGVVQATEKGGRDLRDNVFGTMIIATNKRAAVQLDQKSDNRRFNVYDQGAKGELVDKPDLKARIDAQRLGDGRMTPDMAASVYHYFTVAWREKHGRAPRQSVFMHAQPTVAKRKTIVASRKSSHIYLQDALDEIEAQGRDYVKFGEVEKRAKDLAARDEVDRKSISLFRSELRDLMNAAGGWNGWTRVGDTSAGVDDRVNIRGAKISLLARGQEAVDRFMAMSLDERSEAVTYAPGDDPKLAKIAAVAGRKRKSRNV